MSSVANDNIYEDVFVFGDLVYAMELDLRVVHVYKYHSNAFTKLHDIRYTCTCNYSRLSNLSHYIAVSNEHIIQCCAVEKHISILNRSGGLLLRTIPIPDIAGQWPILCQVDVDGNFLIADRDTNRLLIAHANQPSSQWRVVNLTYSPSSSGCWGAVWFRHRLHLAGRDGYLLTFTPVDKIKLRLRPLVPSLEQLTAQN